MKQGLEQKKAQLQNQKDRGDFGDRHSWELPNPKDDTVIHGEKATVGYAVDPHANAWVFYIAASS